MVMCWVVMDSGNEKVMQQLQALLGQLSLMDPGKQQVVVAPPQWKQKFEKLNLNTAAGLLRAVRISTNDCQDPIPPQIVDMLREAAARGMLALEITDKANHKKSWKLLSHTSYKEIADLQEELRVEKRTRSHLWKENFFFKPVLEELGNDHLCFSLLMQIIWGRLIL
ncbi:hypothetical protein OROMI_020498 [Orobanche minor]